MHKIETPVLLLTGYLGSGKTTLLNRILANSEGVRFAVIVNDIGEVNIDARLIAQGGVVGQQDDSLVPLQNGCICCTLKMDLVKQIADLIATGRFDYIVIEASGVCEPAPIAQTICAIPQMEEYTTGGVPRLDSVCTVVDALRLRDEFAAGADLTRPDIGEEDIASLLIQQIEFCDHILLNKASMVTPDELERIKHIVRTLQPLAPITPCDYCDVPLATLLHTHAFDFDTVAGSAKWIQEVEKHIDDDDEEEEHEHHHDHEHDHHHDHDLHNEDEGEAEEYGIGTFVWHARRPMLLTEFDQFVSRHWPKGVIRAKGICYFKGEEAQCYVFEQAGRQMNLSGAGQWYATMPAEELQAALAANPELARDWDETYGDRMQKLVFIGQHLDRRAITEALNRCLAN